METGVNNRLNNMMSGGLSLQGIPRPDRIILVRGNNQKEPEQLCSTGYYYQSPTGKRVKVAKQCQCRAFALVNQFNGFSLPNPKNSLPCCSYKENYFQYQGVRIPVRYVPDLLQIFNKYSDYADKQ